MCDTMVTLAGDGVLLAKNSDRDPNEAQVVEWHPAAEHPRGSRLRATWVEIEQVRRTHAVVISRPWWMWGAEMGANSRGVVIGNEAVFTTQSTKGEPGLLGMDLLRLALERAGTAEEAVQVIVTLLERYGQVGSCSYENPSFTYHNSFLVADPSGAIVLETAGRKWATEKVRGPARSISNGLTIAGFAEEHSDRLRSRVAACTIRRALTQRGAAAASGPADLFAVLRDNGTGGGPRGSVLNGSMTGPNMHAGGLLTSSQTVASWVSDLRGNPQHWATGTADPATGVFLPVRVDEPADLGPAPTNHDDPATLWWRHERVHRLALRDWARSVQVITPRRDELERRWLVDTPTTAQAADLAQDAREHWVDELTRRNLPETRPGWVRRHWRRLDAAAGFPASRGRNLAAAV